MNNTAARPMPAAAALDYSSLMRFDNAGLARILADRRDRARAARAQHGSASPEFAYAQGYVYRAIQEFDRRGLPLYATA